MAVDWNTVFSGISAIATAAAAVAAFIAINTWKKQKKADLAEEIIIHSQELKAILGWVRCPGAFGEEGKTRSGAENETEDQKHWRDTYFVPLERLRKEHAVISKTPSLKLKAALHFPGVEQHLEEFITIIRNIQVTAGSLIRTVGTRNDYENRQKYEKVIWEMGADEDEIKPKIEKLVADIEAKLKGYL